MLAARIFFGIACLYTFLITWLSLTQLGKISLGDFNPTDKMMHAAAYFILGLVWMFYILIKKPQDFNFNRVVFYISLAVIAFGMLIEVLQGTLTEYRTPDWADILANTIGVLIALGFWFLFQKFLLRLKLKINSIL